MFFREFYEKFYSEISNLSVLFNIFLLLKKGRNAMLLESDTIKHLKKIQDVFGDELKYTFIENNRRVFISVKQLRISESPADNEIAAVLGFQCRGLPDPYTERVAVEYFVSVDSKEAQFYTELCPAKKRIKLREKEWQQLAGDETKVSLIVSNLLPVDFIGKKIKEEAYDEIEEKYMEQFADFLFNASVDLEIFSPIEFLKNKKYRVWLPFFAQGENIFPYSVFGPLTEEEYTRYKAELTALILGEQSPQLPNVKNVILRNIDEEEMNNFILNEKLLMETF